MRSSWSSADLCKIDMHLDCFLNQNQQQQLQQQQQYTSVVRGVRDRRLQEHHTQQPRKLPCSRRLSVSLDEESRSVPQQHFASAAAQFPFNPIPMAAPVSTTMRGGMTRLRSRGVLRLSGTDLLPFLQSLLTNDVSQILSAPSSTSPTATAARCQYTALLHSKGRLLHDLFLHVPHPAHGGGNGDGDRRVLLCDVEAARLGELAARLRRYKLRADVDIADVSEDFAVLASDALPSAAQDDVTSDGSAEGSVLYRDPRLPDLLPRRGIVHADCLLSVAGGQGETDDERGYVAARRAAGVAEGSEEMAIGEALPLEYNLVSTMTIEIEGQRLRLCARYPYAWVYWPHWHCVPSRSPARSIARSPARPLARSHRTA